jgi:hypothetical protein
VKKLELSLSRGEIEVLIDDWLSLAKQDLQAILKKLEGKNISECSVEKLKLALECIEPEIEGFGDELKRVKFLIGKLDEMKAVEKKC